MEGFYMFDKLLFFFRNSKIGISYKARKNPTPPISGSGIGGQLLTGIAARAVNVISNFDGRLRHVNDCVRIDDLVGIIITIIPEVHHDMIDGFVGSVKLCTTTVANLLFHGFGVRLWRNSINVGLFDPIVTECRCSRFRVGVTTTTAFVCTNTVGRAGGSRFAYKSIAVLVHWLGFRRLVGAARIAGRPAG